MKTGYVNIKYSLLWSILLLLWISSSPLPAQTPPISPSEDEVQDIVRSMGMNPERCAALQSQIDQVTSTAGSTLSEADKVIRLSQLLKQTMDSMRQSAANDPEVAQIVNQYLAFMQNILSAISSSVTDKVGNSKAAEEVAKFKIMSQTYVQMMKLMCPNLRIPESVAK